MYKGRWGSTTIALKSIGANKNEFFREADVLIQLRHPNVVLFLGIFNDEGTLYMCTEYVAGGNLIEFLHQKQDELSTTDILKIAHSGVAGLIYLSEHKIVHRGFFFFFFNQNLAFIFQFSPINSNQ